MKKQPQNAERVDRDAQRREAERIEREREAIAEMSGNPADAGTLREEEKEE